jgi:ketosteroid isomerase-like protein
MTDGILLCMERSTEPRHTAEVSQESIELVQNVYARWGKGDFLGAADLFDPSFAYVISAGFPDNGTYAGLERVAAFLRDWLASWASVTMDAEEVLAAGERVVVAVRQESVGRGSGVRGEFRYFHVWTFRGKRAVRLDAVRDRAEALDLAARSE